jgi:hypothetical protein
VLGGQKCATGEPRCGGRGGRIFLVSLTRRARISSPRFSLGAGHRIGRAGQKGALGDVTFFCPARPKSLLGTRLEMLLYWLVTFDKIGLHICFSERRHTYMKT